MSACKPDVTVCMACDFYVPAAGGIETHVLHVARQLSNLGLKVPPVSLSPFLSFFPSLYCCRLFE